MTWQRIDENTYIDDTLVTCAEYQLFIDEMQSPPEHWSRPSFPINQGHEPILGMRYRSAKAFCDWLTLLNKREWRYRLLSQEEAVRYSIDMKKKNISYWVQSKMIKSTRLFEEGKWVEDMPQLGWGIDAQTDARNFRKLDNEFVKPLEQKFSQIDHNIHLRCLKWLSDALIRAQNRPLNINPPSDILLAIDPHLANIREYYNVSDPDRLNKIDHGVEASLNKFVMISNNFSSGSIDMYLDLYVDFLTLKLRILGDSPAFEGIRLAKEKMLDKHKSYYDYLEGDFRFRV